MNGINRRDFLKAMGLGIAGMGLSTGLGCAAPSSTKPNIILVMVTDT